MKDEKILLLKHRNIGPAGYLWSPPGGGVDFGQSLHETLKREFIEETNLIIEVGKYLFANEHIDFKHHALEFFFQVHQLGGELQLGADPELTYQEQILTEARFFSEEEMSEMPSETLHSAFSTVKAGDKINDIRGLLTFKH